MRLLAAAGLLEAAACAATIQTGVLSVGVDVHDHSIFLSLFSFAAAGANTTNLVPAFVQGIASGTLLGLAEQSGALSPVCPPSSCTFQQVGSSNISVTGVQLQLSSGQVVCTEDWDLWAAGPVWQWTVTRTYAGSVHVLVDRLGLALQSTGDLPIHGQQIPSWADLDMFLDQERTSGGFPTMNSYHEYLSPHADQFIRFSPTAALFSFHGEGSYNGRATPCFFSFSKPFADGTADTNIGVECVDPRTKAARLTAAGDTQTLQIAFRMIADDAPVPPGVTDPFPTIDLLLPNATLAKSVATLASVHYATNGWIFGNNPGSVPCLHEMAWFPLISGLMRSDSVAHKMIQKELEFFAGCGWMPGPWAGENTTARSCSLEDGASFGLQQRYASSGFYACPWGPLADQNNMFLIAIYQAAVSSGNLTWLATMRPAVDAMARYLASRGLGLPASGPVVFRSTATGLADGGRHCDNWYDIVAFGNYDAFLAVHGVWSMQCLADIYTALGDGGAAAHAQDVHDAAVRDFNAMFWDANRSQYVDWIDVEGNARHYYYVDIAFTAILAGVANATQTAALLSHYDSRLSEIYSTYGVPPGYIWSPPSNLYPITNSKEFCTGEQSENFPGYENGGSFFHSSALQLAALGAAGRADDAYAAFQALMDSGFGAARGWAQQLYWGKNDTLVGFDPLNSALLPVWGFLRATLGLEPTLTRGLRVVNAPARGMEGARYNLTHLGRAVCVTVEGGVAVFCNGTVV